MDFRPLNTVEREKLAKSLRRNAKTGQALHMNPRDTSFIPDQGEDVAIDEVIAAIKSVPCHYAEITLQRTGQAPLTFTGELIAENSGHRWWNREHNRWHTLSLYQAGNKYVLAIGYCTQWQGEADRDSVFVLDTPDQVSAALRDYEPAKDVGGYPAGEAYRERQEKLIDSITRMFQSQASEILASRREFHENLDCGTVGRVLIVAEKSDDGGYTMSLPSMPGCISEGDTLAAGLRNLAEAIEVFHE